MLPSFVAAINPPRIANGMAKIVWAILISARSFVIADGIPQA
jgi:hypothetical protein